MGRGWLTDFIPLSLSELEDLTSDRYSGEIYISTYIFLFLNKKLISKGVTFELGPWDFINPGVQSKFVDQKENSECLLFNVTVVKALFLWTLLSVPVIATKWPFREMMGSGAFGSGRTRSGPVVGCVCWVSPLPPLPIKHHVIPQSCTTQSRQPPDIRIQLNFYLKLRNSM